MTSVETCPFGIVKLCNLFKRQFPCQETTWRAAVDFSPLEKEGPREFWFAIYNLRYSDGGFIIHEHWPLLGSWTYLWILVQEQPHSVSSHRIEGLKVPSFPSFLVTFVSIPQTSGNYDSHGTTKHPAVQLLLSTSPTRAISTFTMGKEAGLLENTNFQ